MTIRQLAPSLHIIRGPVNIYVLETDDGLALLDTGLPNSAQKVLDGVRALGHQPGDIRHIVLTHLHPDHTGSAAVLKRETGATVWAHPIEAPMIEAGTAFRHPIVVTPGLRNKVIARLLLGRRATVEPTKVDRFIEDGDSLPFLPDLVAFHSPGHSAGQIAFRWQRHGGVLFTADTCVNQFGLGLSPAGEDLALSRKSLARLSKLDFEMICFMHGRPIMSGGDTIFRRTSFG